METEYDGLRVLRWWHEVRAMGVARAAWRAGYELRKRLGLVARKRAPDAEDAAAVLGEFDPPFADERALLAHFRRRRRGRFLFDAAPPEAYVAALEQAGAAGPIVAAADEACRRRFHLLGQTFDFAGGEIDWHYEPQAGRSWPAVPWDRLDIRGRQRIGDVKFTWELNRHQHWPTLGLAYWLTGDDRYAGEWAKQFDGWCRQNPPEIGVNWASNLEHALRIVSWWTAARLLMDSHAMTGSRLRRLIGLLACKARHIIAELPYSRVNMANNHLIGDAAGLAVLGLAVPELRDAPAWRRLALGILWRQARRQIHADGSSIECSAGYHRFVLQLYLLVLHLAEANGVAVPLVVRRRVERMAGFLAAAVRPDGTLPQFGDFDSGRAYRFGCEGVEDFRPVLSTAAVLLRRADFKRAAGRVCAETICLLGPQAADVLDSLIALPQVAARSAFEQGGLFGERTSGGAQVFVKNGPFTSHTHADLLSLCLHDGRQDVLVDAGTYTYNGDWRWRTHFRTTRAHNAVTVDGRGQAAAHRVFRWLFPPRARNHFFAADGRFVFDGRHDGFRRRGVGCRRIVLALGERDWLCLDLLAGKGTHEAAIHWHPAPHLAVADQGEGAVTARDGAQVVLTIAAAAEAALDLHIARGDEQTPAGWYSAEYGVIEPGWDVTYAVRGRLPLCAASVLSLGEASLAPAAVQLDGERIRVRLDRPGGGGTADTMDVTYYLWSRGGCRRGELALVARIDRPGEPPERVWARCLGRPT